MAESISRNGQSVDPIVLGMSADELYESDLRREIEGDDEAVVSAANLEYRSLGVERARAAVCSDEVVHTPPVDLAHRSQPLSERLGGFGMHLPKVPERRAADDPHERELCRLRMLQQ
jgi:hypothetical protein